MRIGDTTHGGETDQRDFGLCGPVPIDFNYFLLENAIDGVIEFVESITNDSDDATCFSLDHIELEYIRKVYIFLSYFSYPDIRLVRIFVIIF